MFNIDFEKLVPMIFPHELVFIDNGNNLIEANCGYPKPNAYGYLVFFKPNSLDMKYVYIGKNDSMNKTYIVHLDGRGCIPKDMVVYFDCENELYDIWVYRSTFDPTQDYKPCDNCTEPSLIEILRNQPTYAFLYNQNNNSEVTAQANLIRYGEFEQNLINLPSSEDFKFNQTRYGANKKYINEAISENIFFVYENQTVTNPFREPIEDYLTINTFSENVISENPRNFLRTTIRNILADPQALPDRFLTFRFTHGLKLDKKPFVLSFYARYNNRLDNNNVELKFYFKRIIGGTEAIFELTTSIPNNTIKLTNSWEKYIIPCTVENPIVRQSISQSNSECFIMIKILNTFREQISIEWTSFTLNYGLSPIKYSKTEEITTFNPKLIQESTVGQIIDYLWVDKLPQNQDRATSIVADGRAVKTKDYYQLNENTPRIPYSLLFNYIGYKFGSGDKHFNAYSLHEMLSTFKSATVLGDVVFSWNYQIFNPVIDVSNAADAIEITMISKGFNFKKNSIPLNIDTSFVYNENEGSFAIGYMVDSEFKKTDLSYLSSGVAMLPPTKHVSIMTGNTNFSKDSAIGAGENAKFSSLFAANNDNYKSFGILGGSKNIGTKDSSSIGSELAPKTDISYPICYYNKIGKLNTPDSSSAVIEVVLEFKYSEKTPKLENITEAQFLTKSGNKYTINISTSSKFTNTENQDIQITHFLTKYQIEGKPAYIFKILGSNNINFKGKYFVVESLSGTFNFWFQTTPTDNPPSVINNHTMIPIDLVGSDYGKISIANAIEKAVNSYIFCIPNLQETILYAVGTGKQTAEYGKEDLTKFQYQTSFDDKVLKGHQVPISSQSMQFKNSIFEFRAEQCALRTIDVASAGSSSYEPHHTLWKKSDPYPRTATIRHISLI